MNKLSDVSDEGIEWLAPEDAPAGPVVADSGLPRSAAIPVGSRSVVEVSGGFAGGDHEGAGGPGGEDVGYEIPWYYQQSVDEEVDELVTEGGA